MWLLVCVPSPASAGVGGRCRFVPTAVGGGLGVRAEATAKGVTEVPPCTSGSRKCRPHNNNKQAGHEYAASTSATEQHRVLNSASPSQQEIRGVATMPQKCTVLTTPEADTTGRKKEVPATTQGNGKHLTPTLAASTGHHTAQQKHKALID